MRRRNERAGKLQFRKREFFEKAACGNVGNFGELPTFPRGTTTIFHLSTNV